MIDYTFIIPHKNSLDLLQRCLDSIPRREGVQIVVVDDNSDPEKVDFSHFPCLNDPFVEVFLTKEGRGAGYARNVGLKHAKGKWLIFADADDFFLPDIEKAMDEYKGSEADVIFFKGTAIVIPTGAPSNRGMWANDAVDNAIITGDYTIVSLLSYPYKKFIKREVVEKKHIRFNESRWANDVMFCSRIAVSTNNYVASSYSIYCLTESEHSLIKEWSLESRVVRFEQETESIELTKRKYPELKQLYQWYFGTWFDVYKCSKLKGALLVPKAISAGGIDFVRLCFKAKFSRKAS